MLIDSPANDKEYKSKLANIIFEKVKAASLLFMDSSSLSLFATGSTTGLVV
jgi:actin beta/gamma 1